MGIFDIGGPSGLIRWLHARLDQQLDSPETEDEAQVLLALAWRQVSRPSVRDSIIKDHEARHDPAQAEARAAQQRQVLREREQQRRQHDPRAELQARLERTVATPQPQHQQQAQAHRGRHNGSRPIGECGQRIGAAIDAVLADIKAMEDESTWPDDEFPWEGLEALIAEVQAEAAPDGLDALLAEIHADAEPMAAAALVEPEPPMPVVLAVEQEPELEPEQPQASSVWEQLDLSPRARALGALVAALQGAPAECQVCLPVADAVALLEAVL